MPYNNIPGIRATFGDQFLSQQLINDQPKILVIGTGASGRAYEPRSVVDLSREEQYYGRTSEISKGLHEVFSQGARNLSTIRIGGSQGLLTLTDADGGTLAITTAWRGEDALSRYNFIMEQYSGANRYIIYDNQEQAFVYDSAFEIVEDLGYFDIVDINFALGTVGSRSQPDSTSLNFTLAAIALTDLTAVGSTLFTGGSSALARTEGVNGETPSLIQRYAQLEAAYDVLDFRDFNMFYPIGVYIDDTRVEDETSTATTNFGYYGKGGPTPGSSHDALGYVWQYRYQGQTYTYFVESDTYFTDIGSSVAATVTVNTDLVITAQKVGLGGNAHTIEINAGGAAGPTATITETTSGLNIAVEDDGSEFTDEAVTVINTALQNFVMANGRRASTILVASGGDAATAITNVSSTPLAGGLGVNAAATHEDLTGESIPTVVSTAFAAAVTANADAELAEVNFYHQALSFAHRVSRVQNMVQTAMNFKRPTSVFPRNLGSWVGDLPTYTTLGNVKAVSAPADNGTGLLGNKFFAGESETSNGYRSHLVTEGNSTDGYAYGGWIKTAASNLPVTSDFAYGINDGDEELGSINGAPVDIGRYGYACAGWPVLFSKYNGNTRSRAPQAGLLLGKMATLPENVAPIGDNGAFVNINQLLRIRAEQIDALAGIRITTIRNDNGDLINTKGDTSAHPDSDWVKGTTVRSISRQLAGIRNIMRPYIGKPFQGTIISTLQSEIDRYLSSERLAGFNNGFRGVSLTYTAQERILGILNAEVRIVPPGAIEHIPLRVSLAADEADL